MIVKWIKGNSVWILLGLLLSTVTLIRLRLLNIPLERDEGEYAYMGQLILQGIPPYKIVYNMKFPGTYYMYAFFMSIFGQNTEGIHLGLLVTNLLSIILLFLLVKKLISNYAAFTACIIFSLLSISAPFCGFAGHATHFVLLPALAGILLLYKASKGNKITHYVLSGLLLGVAPIMKQPGVFFSLFGFLFLVLLYFKRTISAKTYLIRLVIFCIAGIFPFLLMLLILSLYGVIDKFWFWTFKYASAYANQVPVNEIYPQFKVMFGTLFQKLYLIWIFAGIGIVMVFFHPNLKRNFHRPFILLLLIFSIISVCPGFYFREHYFITLIPALSILFAIFTDYLYIKAIQLKKLQFLKYVSFGLFIISVGIGVIYQREYLFKTSPKEISRQLYWFNPFVESPEIAKYIKEHSGKDDKIAIIGSEPQIFFYANRQSATGYIYTYSLMEIHEQSLDMQKEMISEIEAAQPTHLVYVHISASWLAQKNSQTHIFEWINPYLQKNQFYQVGVVDISGDKTYYKWDEEAIDYQPMSEYFIQIFERKR